MFNCFPDADAQAQARVGPGLATPLTTSHMREFVSESVLSHTHQASMCKENEGLYDKMNIPIVPTCTRVCFCVQSHPVIMSDKQAGRMQTTRPKH